MSARDPFDSHDDEIFLPRRVYTRSEYEGLCSDGVGTCACCGATHRDVDREAENLLCRRCGLLGVYGVDAQGLVVVGD